MSFGGEKIEKLLADFTAFHVLHPSLITLQQAVLEANSERAGQGAHHTTRGFGGCTPSGDVMGYAGLCSNTICMSMTFVPVGPVLKWLSAPDAASNCRKKV